ncbi:unnamed protein product [Arabidopsis lyrata]|nr:unnamed protein product [Arabidopsis lyrata]
MSEESPASWPSLDVIFPATRPRRSSGCVYHRESCLWSAYRPGDIVRMSKMGQYHSSRITWHDVIGKHCPIFAVNREVLIPIAKPIGYT